MAGDAIDWSYASAGIEWSYSAELRDTGTVSMVSHRRKNIGLTFFFVMRSMASSCLEV